MSDETLLSNQSKSTFADYSEAELSAVVVSVKRLEKIFKEEFQLDLYLTWGTLLGAVREGDFIKFDNDVDVAYMSRQSTDFEVAEEHELIVRVLQDLSFPVQRHSKGQIHVQVSPSVEGFTGAIYNLDLWTTWTRNGKYFHYPDIKGEIIASEVLPLKPHRLREDTFLIPADYSRVLVEFYGDNWSEPDPNYAWYPKYDINDEFQFLRSPTFRSSIPEYPAKTAALQIDERDGFYFVSGKGIETQRLNPTAMLILELCDGVNRPVDIIRMLERAFDLPTAPEVVTLEFLSSAADIGLIDTSNYQ